VAGAEFHLEKILRYRRSPEGQEFFFVKWAGYPTSEATWEPLGNVIGSCQELVWKVRKAFSGALGAAAACEEGGKVPDNLDEEPASSSTARAPPAKRPKLDPQMVMPSPPEKDISDDDVPEEAAPVKRLVARELKCICGATEKVDEKARKKLIVCHVCHSGLHPICVQEALRTKRRPDAYVCPPCRLERVDEFHPPVGSGVLKHSYASSSQAFTISFTCQSNQWRAQQWAVHLRAVSLAHEQLAGPAWPNRVQAKLNGKVCVVVDPPKHLHVRREHCYNLTPLLKQGPNQLELRFTAAPDRPKGEPEERYCVGVVLTRPRSVASMIARIRTRSTETVDSGQERVRRLIAQVSRKERKEEDCMVTGTFGRLLKPLCPVSLCPIEESAIGRHCNHVQVFDLQAYIAVNQKMRSLEKRWTCPVCSISLRPDEVVLDPFAQGILDVIRGHEVDIEAVLYREDCTWATIYAPTDDKEGEAAGEVDCLSDSE